MQLAVAQFINRHMTHSLVSPHKTFVKLFVMIQGVDSG